MSATLRAALATVLVTETIEGAHHAARIALEASEPPATGLDAAWAKAEAALPEGWRIDTLRVGRSYPHETKVEWVVWAERPDYFEPRDGRTAFARGPTPAAALEALAARLTGATE